jgi:hypothetical protein
LYFSSMNLRAGNLSRAVGRRGSIILFNNYITDKLLYLIRLQRLLFPYTLMTLILFSRRNIYSSCQSGLISILLSPKMYAICSHKSLLNTTDHFPSGILIIAAPGIDSYLSAHEIFLLN